MVRLEGNRTLGLLVSIASYSRPWRWHNVARSVGILEPTWSSLGIDTWNSNRRQAVEQKRVYQLYGGTVLKRFSQYRFFAGQKRRHMDAHVRSSVQYAAHWLHALMYDHPVRVPDILVGLDADIVVSPTLPLAQYARILEEDADEMSQLSVDQRTLAGERVWVGPRGPTGGCDPSESVRCSLVKAPRRIVYVHPNANPNTTRVHQWLGGAVARLRAHGRTDCCGYHHYAPPARFEMPTAFLHRGPHCPPTSFWLLHRRTLPLLLATMLTWRKIIRRLPANQTSPDVRLEFVGCSLLAFDEGVLVTRGAALKRPGMR